MGTSLDDNVTHEPDPRDPRGGETLEDVARAKGGVTRRQVLVAAGCGVAGLVAGGVLAKWGCQWPYRHCDDAPEDDRDRPGPLFGVPALRNDVHAEKRWNGHAEQRPRACSRDVLLR